MREIDNWLFEEFDQRHQRNKSYSLRSFARDINLSISFLSRIFKGTSNISEHKAKEICQVLKLNKENANEILKQYKELNKIQNEIDQLVHEEMTSPLPSKNIIGLSATDCIKLSNWYSPLVLHFIEGYHGSEEKIKEQFSLDFNVKTNQLNETIKTLIDLNLIEYNQTSYQKKIDDYYLLTDGSAIEYEELRKNHIKASQELLHIPQDQSFIHNINASNSFDFTLLPVNINDFIFEKLYYDFYSETKNKYFKTYKSKEDTYCIQLYFINLTNWNGDEQ